jgi:Asparagine synthase (glutamine-hydrolyzing)
MEGADEAVVRDALERGDPLPGTSGFAGFVDGTLVRDVLGRSPLFVESEATDGQIPRWSHDPTDLTGPTLFPAGHAWDDDGTREVWTLPDPAPFGDRPTAVNQVRDAVENSVDAVDTDGLAIAFSGGVDSALLAARLNVPLYVAGFPDSHDVEAARSAAELLDRELRVVELAHEDIERAVPEIVAATGRTNAMAVQIALPLYLVAEQVAADGFDRLALGQGADELFGGYAKVARLDSRVAADSTRAAVRETVRSLPDGLARDVPVLRAAGVEPVLPYLDDQVVRAALRLPARLLVRDDERKVALRRVAADRLPADLAAAPKKAAQYGSYVSRELDRLARQAGFKRRQDDHVRRYVESLC